MSILAALIIIPIVAFVFFCAGFVLSPFALFLLVARRGMKG